MAPQTPPLLRFSLFVATVLFAVAVVAASLPLGASASAFPEVLDARSDALFPEEALTHLSESLTKCEFGKRKRQKERKREGVFSSVFLASSPSLPSSLFLSSSSFFSLSFSLPPQTTKKVISDAKELASRAVDSFNSMLPEDLSSEEERRDSSNALAALLAADPLAGASLLPPLSSSSASSPCSHKKKTTFAPPPPLDDDVLEAFEALEAAGADKALFAPIFFEDESLQASSSISVDLDETADGGVEASAVSVSSVPVSPASILSSSSHLDAALDIQYGAETAGASAVTRRVARWVSSLGDSPTLVASLSSSSSSDSLDSLDAARAAFDAAADAIEAVGVSLAAALESRPGADDAELDLAVAVDLVGASTKTLNNIVDVRIEASVVPGSGITRAMLAEALEGASFDAVVAAGAAGVEVFAAHVDVFDEEDEDEFDNEEEFDLSSSSLFSYSEREDAFCLYLGSFLRGGVDKWACARRQPLSRALAATSLFFAAASAVAAFNALASSSSSSSDDDESDSESDEEELDEVVDEEATLLIKPALWALDSKA